MHPTHKKTFAQGKRPFRVTEKGFALVAAIIASLILLALAILVIQLSTGDLRTGAQIVGEKKALAAVDTGINQLTVNFNPLNPVGSTGGTGDQHYTVGTPTAPTAGPLFIPMTGYSIGGGQQWGQRMYVVDVTGRNTTYNTAVTIDAGVGYGPVEISTMSR